MLIQRCHDSHIQKAAKPEGQYKCYAKLFLKFKPGAAIM
jgi:hypothetical protein